MNNQKLDFVLAFPGLGKTTVAREVPGLQDLDFGHLRKAFRVSKDNEHQLLEAYSQLILEDALSGLIVLINEPKVLPYLKQKHLEGVVVLPSAPAAKAMEYADRIRMRGGKGNEAFARMMEQNYWPWVQSWARAAKKYGYRWCTTDYLSGYFHKEEHHEEKENASIS